MTSVWTLPSGCEARKAPNIVLKEIVAEMRQYLRGKYSKDLIYYRTLMDYYKKFSIPMCSPLVCWALPLGFQSTAWPLHVLGHIRGWSFLFLLYNPNCRWGYGELGKYPPVLGMWMPNIIFLATCCVFPFSNRRRASQYHRLLVRVLDWFLRILGRQ